MLYYFIPYIGMSIYHCVQCRKGNQKNRAASKCFLMPMLALGYFLEGGTNLFVFLALLFGLIGDIILIKPQEYNMKVAGSSTFAIGHVMYFMAFIRIANDLPDKIAYYLIIVAFMAVGLFIYSRVKEPIIPKMRVSCLAYFLLLSGMAGLSVLIWITGAATGAGFICCAVGYAFFLCSDSILVKQWFTVGDPHPASDLKVMITYCAAQLLIVYGILICSVA